MIYAGVYIFNILTMIYGIWRYFFNTPSSCAELHLFCMVLSYIFSVWIIFLIYEIWVKVSVRFGGRQQRLNEALYNAQREE
jgi:hypothetical protein